MRTRLHKRLSRLIRGRLQRALLSDHGIGIVAEARSGLYVVEPGDFGVGRQLLREGAYDHAALAWLQGALPEEADTIVVAGAHVGTIMIPLARIARRVIAFEADPVSHRLAGMNLLLNRVENVTLLNQALGEREGRAAIRRNPINTGNSSIARPGEPTTIEVPMTTLDRALKTMSIGPVDLVVIDVEGHEARVLEGGDETIRRARMLYVEYAPEQLAEYGSKGKDVIDRAFSRFDYLYVLENGEVALDRTSARDYLDRRSRNRGFLVNLLFSREPLNRDRR